MLFVELRTIHPQAVDAACAMRLVEPHPVKRRANRVDAVVNLMAGDDLTRQPARLQELNAALAGLKLSCLCVVRQIMPVDRERQRLDPVHIVIQTKAVVLVVPKPVPFLADNLEDPDRHHVTDPEIP